jgi:dihydrofolate reductase
VRQAHNLMRKLICFNMITIDGFFEGPNQDIGWHTVDEEFNEFAIDQLDSVDILLFGRVTYELMASYWPTELALKDDPIVAEKMNSKSKLVFSKTLDKADWNNTHLVRENIRDEILKLKSQPGKDLIILGSSDLSASLAQAGLIDEYRLMVSPVILGSGKNILHGLPSQLALKLLKTRIFRNGNVLLYYQPA